VLDDVRGRSLTVLARRQEDRGGRIPQDVDALERPGIGSDGHDGDARPQAGQDRDDGLEGRRSVDGDHSGARQSTRQRINGVAQLAARQTAAVHRHGAGSIRLAVTVFQRGQEHRQAP
jgi:hypothetical protein